MAPPAKRRKRNVVRTSDDEEEEVVKRQPNTLDKFLVSSPDPKSPSTTNASRTNPASPSPAARKPSRPTLSSQPIKPAIKPLQLRSNRGSSNKEQKVASTSPEKPKIRPHDTKERKGKTADLKSLFAKQAERAPKASQTTLEEISSDPISDDDEIGMHRASNTSRVGNNAMKRFRDGTQNIASSASSSAPTASQKFLRPPRPPRDPNMDDEQRPWFERFRPVNLEELAVHKRKVADVRRWLEDVMAGKMRQRLLILKGAAGTGKTTTVRLLAKDMQCELLEWKNPTPSAHGFQSVSAQFDEFMSRGGKFGQLDLDSDASSAPGHVTKDDSGARKIILIEEFPNTFARASTPLQSFRSTILQYLVDNTPPLATFAPRTSEDPITPVIMVISETLLTTTSASADSFTVHRLLGPEITRHPGTAIIEFNAIAPTLLAGALGLIVQKEARKSGRKRTPGPLVLKRLGEIGDIRSAVSSLEFLCLKGDDETNWGSKVTFTKPKRAAKDDIALTKAEQESLELVSQREASLGIFHAVGKVVYNKRDEIPAANRTPEGAAEMLPGFLDHCSRPKPSQVSVDTLIDEIGTDTHTFISALHENYVLSCEPTGADDLSSSIDYANDCLDYLSASDLLCPSSDVFFGGRGSSFSGRDSASHLLRQDEITFQVATRGLLFSLPNPVKRVGTKSGRVGGDSHKMFYPTSLKLWREREELESLVDHWSTKLMQGEDAVKDITDGASAFRKPKPVSDSGDWASRQSSRMVSNPRSKSGEAQDKSSPLLSLGSSARREMLLERLPYMAHIARRRKSSFNNVRLRDLEKVVSFSGINGVADDEAAEANEVNGITGEAWATDRPTEESSPRKKSFGIRQKSDGSVSTLSVDKLVISDDDIEDD